MKMKPLMILALCSLTVLAADRSKNKAVQKEIGKFQGQWEFISFDVDGAPKPVEEYKKYKVFFEEDLWTVYEDGKIAAQSNFQPDPGQKPKSIDIHLKLDGGKTRLIRGIYKFKKDTLTICDRGEEKGDRPTRFATAPNTGLVLVTMRRVAR